MRFDVDAAGQTRQVDVAADGSAWQVTIAGRVWRASMVRAGERWSLLLSDVLGGPRASSRSYDVMFEPGAGGAWQVHVNGRSCQAGLRTSAQRLRGHWRGGRRRRARAGADARPRGEGARGRRRSVSRPGRVWWWSKR
jgi:hypothetical protein